MTDRLDRRDLVAQLAVARSSGDEREVARIETLLARLERDHVERAVL